MSEFPQPGSLTAASPTATVKPVAVAAVAAVVGMIGSSRHWLNGTFPQEAFPDVGNDTYTSVGERP